MLVTSPQSPASRWVLRVRPGAPEGDWWREARTRRDAPASISALLNGRDRLEVTPDEATDAIAWAAGLDGWGGAAQKPLFIHQPDSAEIR